MLLKYYALKALPNIVEKKDQIIKEIQKQFKVFLRDLNCRELNYLQAKFLKVTQNEVANRKLIMNI